MYLNHFFKGRTSKDSHILRCWGFGLQYMNLGDTVQPLTPKQRKRNEPPPLPTSAVPPYSPSGPTDTPSSPTSDLQAEPRLRHFTSSNPVGICRSRTKTLAPAVQATVTCHPGYGARAGSWLQPRPPTPPPPAHTLIRGSPSSLSSWFSSYSVFGASVSPGLPFADCELVVRVFWKLVA